MLKCFMIICVAVVGLSSCKTKTSFSSIEVLDEHYPAQQIELRNLSAYQIAFCLGVDSNLNSVNLREGEKIVSLRISFGDKSKDQVISTNYLRIHPSPYITQPQAGHPTNDDVGCISSAGRDIRFNTHELFWKPYNNSLAFVAGFDPMSADYRLFEFQDDLTFSEKDPPITFHDYNKYFMAPRWVYWSPDSWQFATLGSNIRIGNAGSNIWLYDIPAQKLQEVTHFTRVGNEVATAAWSNNGKMLAVGYGGPASGIAVATLGEQKQYFEISSNTHSNQVREWPHWITSSLFNLLKGMYDGKDSTENFNAELAANSTPVWINYDQQVIFVGANTKGKASLFIVNSDGSDLHELLPGLPGIALMPRLSPDGKILAFARFPDWNDRSKVEIATVDLVSMEFHSVAVFPRLLDGSILFVSGMDWSSDSKYLALSVPYKDESEILIISKDGKSWINFTEGLNGDAVSPVWKP